METPSEWAKRFNRQKTGEEAGLPNPEAETVASPAPVAEFPTEAFPCPTCGQLLGASCRVCVACGHTIDPAEIAKPQDVSTIATAARAEVARPGPVRFPWRIFFAVLVISFLLAQVFIELWGLEKAQLAMGGAQTLAGIWVFFDALSRRIPCPWRWGLGSMLLPVIIFPWYLARRKVPESACPFVERAVGPFTRILFLVLAAFFLLYAIFSVLHGPAPK
jgi:hypothetical protein